MIAGSVLAVGKVAFMFDSVGMSSMAKPALSARLSPDELEKLAEKQTGSERLRLLAVADALKNLAEIKKRLLKYQRRLLN